MCSWIVINYAWSPIGVPTHSSTNPGDEILCDLRRRHMKQRYISGIRWGVRENGGQGRDGEREVTWWGEGGVVWVMCQKRRGGPDREPGVRTSESKNRFQSEKKVFLNLEISPFLRPLGALTFSFFFFFFFWDFATLKHYELSKWWWVVAFIKCLHLKLLLRKIRCKIVILFTR